MNEQELKNQIESLQREYLDLRSAISSLAGNLNNNAILRGTLSGAGVSAESILKCIIRKERINVKTKDPKIPIERADEIRNEEVRGLMLDEMIRLVEKRIPVQILTHLRTIQAWRNIGSHDKGENNISETVNSNTLQLVSLALSELVNWFVGEYLNQDVSGFIYNETISEENILISTFEWQEEYWFAMKKGSLKVLDEAKLNKIQHLHNISNSEIESIKSNFDRKEELFMQILNEAFEDGIIDIDELEAIEHSRTDCCISLKETKEILESFHWKAKFKDNPENLNVDWMRDELVSNFSHKTIEPNLIPLANINFKTINLSFDLEWSAIKFRTLFSTFFNFIYFRIENNKVPNDTKLSDLISDNNLRFIEISENMTLDEFITKTSQILNKKIDVYYQKENPISKNINYVKFTKNSMKLTLTQANDLAIAENAMHLEFWYKPHHS